MELFSFDAEGRHFAVVLDFDLRLERLLIDQTLMSVKPLGEATSVHVFEDARWGRSQLSFSVNTHTQNADYQLQPGTAEAIAAVAELSEPAKLMVASANTNANHAKAAFAPKTNWLVLGSIAIKLFKTAKVVKVALVAASVAVYSVMFTVEFALALVAVLMFHEYGHVRAMKRFGIPTKGFYLIPFLGGIAVGDKAKTQWESLYISMMGPVYGLLMTAVFYVIFLATESHFCGLLAATSALLNLFNLLPIHPLDGGQVIKALVFSRRNKLALLLFLGVSSVCLYAAWAFGFYFLCFFIVIGVVDIISNWSVPISADMTPLKTYGIWFSLVWYLAVTLAFIAMIVLLVVAQVPGAEIATKILSS
jgi:putative peptide zinc metalloprotease protein